MPKPKSTIVSATPPVETLPQGESLLELDDGSVEVTLDDTPTQPQEFQANLADVFDSTAVKHLGSELVEIVVKDKESRKRRDEQYE